MHTMQTAFDAALNGIRAQGYVKSIMLEGDENETGVPGRCEYIMKRDGSTLRCGVGHMLDEATCNGLQGSISSIFKVEGVYGEQAQAPAVRDQLSHLGEDFLGAVQQAHDNYLQRADSSDVSIDKGIVMFEALMGVIAYKFGLAYKPVGL